MRGDFPEEDEGVLLKLSDLEAAVDLELDTEGQAVTFGVDPARFGADASALAVWQGNELLSVETRRQLDTMEVASWIASEINRLKPTCVTIDEIGLGAGVLDRLRQLNRQGIVTGLNVGSRASRPDLYLNTRAEIFWRFREALERREVKLPDDEQLLAELSALRFEYSQSGQIKLEPKDDTKKRVGRSPDLADAAVLGFEWSPSGALDVSGLADALGDINEEFRTRGGMVDDLPSEVDPPTRQELGLADPISIGFLDFHSNWRRR